MCSYCVCVKVLISLSVRIHIVHSGDLDNSSEGQLVIQDEFGYSVSRCSVER